MFLKTSELKKVMKSALKSRGLTVGNMDGQYLVYCDFWGVCVDAVCASNKFKAAIMELTGDLPEDGECYRCSLSPEREIEQERVYDIPAPFEDWKAAKDCAVMTPLFLTAWPHEYAIFQRKSDLEFLTADRTLAEKMISPSELDQTVESMPGRPSVLAGTVLYFKNDTTIYWVRATNCGEKVGRVLFPCMSGIDFFESDWILKEDQEMKEQEEKEHKGGAGEERLPY